MNKFTRILADHDDVLTHGIILYSNANDPDHVYADKACTIPVEGDELKDIYLKGCVVATVSDGVETGSYSKPASLEVTPEGDYKLGFGGGASSWNDLTDKPFYAEAALEPITWDGNTEGLVVAEYDGYVYYKVSDRVLTDDQIKHASYGYSNTDDRESIGDYWDTLVSDGNATDDIVCVFGEISIVRKAGVTDTDGVTYPEVGVYFYVDSDYYVTDLTFTDIVKQIDPKFVPDSGAKVFTVYYSNNINGYYVANMSYNDFIASVEKNPFILGAYVDMDNTNTSEFIKFLTGYMPPSKEGEPITLYFNNMEVQLSFDSSNEICYSGAPS